MFIATKVIVDRSGQVIQHDYAEYNGPIALCKGDDTLKQSEQQQAAFNQQLMATFNTQFAKQNSVLNFLQSKLKPMIENPQGLSPEALAAQRTGATDTLSQQYQNAQKTLNATPGMLNNADLPSGVAAQIKAGLLQGEAGDKSAALNNITLQNENLKQNNFWNALNVMNGQTAVYNPLGYAGQATAGSSAVANLGEAYQQSKGPSWVSALSGIAGGVAGGLTSHFFPAGKRS